MGLFFMSYQVVFLDADDTLFDYTRCEAYALNEAFKKAGLPEDPRYAASYRVINQQLWNDFEKGLVTLEVLRSERFRRLFEEFGLKVDMDAEQLSASYLSYLGQASYLVEGAVEICEYLKSKYRLAIITNGIKEVQVSRLLKSGLQDYFEHMIVSEDAGFQKPHTGIFEHACRLIGHEDKSAAIMIGDSLSSDIEGGRRFGIDTVWFNIHGKENMTGIRPHYEIRRLEELRHIL